MSAEADESKVSATVFPLNGESKLVWVSGRHRQVLKELDTAILEGRGVLLLTGESGSGKTVLTRAILNGLVGTGVRVARVAAPVQDGRDLYTALGYQVTDGDFLRGFRGFLGEMLAQGQRLLLVVDDAQALRPDVLAELVRLLETHQRVDEGKIGVLNILLVGSSELETIVREPRQAGLAQLIRVRCTLHPLTTNEVAGYVQYHLGVAGFDLNWFTLEAMEEIWTRSRGIPRAINVICDRTLRAALLAGATTVDAELVRQSLPEEMSDPISESREESKGFVRHLFRVPRPAADPEIFTKEPPEEVADLPDDDFAENDVADEDRRWRIVRIGGATALALALALGLVAYFGWRPPSRDATRPAANSIVEQEIDRSDAVALPEKPEPSVAPISPPPPPQASSPSVPPRAGPPPGTETAPRAPETVIPTPAAPRAATSAGGQGPSAVTPAGRQGPSASPPEKASFTSPQPTSKSPPPARGAAPAVVRPPAQDDPDPGAIIDWLLKQSPSRLD